MGSATSQRYLATLGGYYGSTGKNMLYWNQACLYESDEVPAGDWILLETQSAN